MNHYSEKKFGLLFKTIIILILGIILVLLLIYYNDINNNYTQQKLQKNKFVAGTMDKKIIDNFKNQPITWDSLSVRFARTSTGKPVIVYACDNGFGGTTESGTVIHFTKKMQLIAGTGPNNEPWFWLVNEDASIMKIFPHVFRNKL